MTEWKSNNARETAIARIVHLEKENEELKRTLSKSMYALQENEELNKDKERLDWLLQSRYRGELETREAIDKAFDAGFEPEADEY